MVVQMNILNPKIAGLITLIVGIGFLGWGFHMQRKAAASESWPSTMGKIVVSKVDHTHDTSSNGNKWYYRPTVEYTYKAEGLSYTNNKIDFSPVSWKHNKEYKAKRVISPYTKGKRVEIFYDPLSPQDSVLRKGAVAGPPWGYIIGAGGLLIGGFLVFRST